MNDSTFEDGVLATCGICGCEVHMLDPEEQDWICDPCSLEGWSGTKAAWRLSTGDVVALRSDPRSVLLAPLVPWRVASDPLIDNGRLSVEVERGGEVIDLFMRVTSRVYVHCNRIA